jgi:NitT/TauT family transport system ATP-binding protein
MTTRLRIGFLPLVDAALLVVAREEGFAEQEGLSLDLVREASWANLRDRLSVGLLDAAQMLAPAAIAATLGLGHLRVAMAAPTMLSLNGASITVSAALYDEMTKAAQGDLAEAGVAAAAFAEVAAARVAAGGAPPVLATVFAYSTHTLLIGAFLRLAKLKPEADIPLVVLPPQYTVASLASGQIDGFCAGAPWNAVAVASGAGAIAAFGVDLMPDAPEKLLVMRADDVERRTETAIALTRATLAAAAWAEKAENRERLARHLARADIVDTPVATIEAVLAGRIEVGAGRPPRSAPDYLRIDRATLAPSAAVADRLIEAMIAGGQLADAEDARAAARRVFRDDLFAEALKSAR